MNTERIILANYENIHIANHYANLLTSEGISCSVEGINTYPEKGDRSQTPIIYILKVSAKQEGIARTLLQSDDPWFLPQIQAPISQQYRLIGAILVFVGLLCSFISLGTPQVKWIGFPLGIAGIGILLFIHGILRGAEDFENK